VRVYGLERAPGRPDGRAAFGQRPAEGPWRWSTNLPAVSRSARLEDFLPDRAGFIRNSAQPVATARKNVEAALIRRAGPMS